MTKCHRFVYKFHQRKLSGFQAVIAVPSGVTPIEMDAAIEVVKSAGADKVFLIEGAVAGATIKVVESASIAAIQGSDFKDIIHKFPTVQMYLARLLTVRLAASNVQRTEINTSGMSGNLSQMSATELLQALELSQKSGKLTLTLPQGSAQLLINGGNLIRADYCNKAGKEAVFEILKEREGRFTFSPDLPEDQLDAPEIGSLMEILLDASRMIDEKGGDYECGSSLGCHAGG